VLAPYASARAAALLLAHGGGRSVGMTAVEAPHDPVVVEIDAGLPARVAGMAIDKATVVERLVAVGCVVREDGDALAVTPPTWRPDLGDPADLVEEVLRLGGYDAIPTRVPRARVGAGLTSAQRARRRVGRALAADGYVEAPAYPSWARASSTRSACPGRPRRQLLLLANPLSDEQPGMRTTLLPGILATLRRNVGRGTGDVALFEAGAVVHLREGQQPRGGTPPPRPDVAGRPHDDDLAALEALLPDQPWHVAVALAGSREPGGWWGPARPSSWADAVEAARLVAEAVGAALVVRRGSAPAPWHPGRCAELVVDGVVVGHAGELAPRVCEQAGLPPRTCAMELDLDALVAAAGDVVVASGLSTYPVAKEDLALVVDRDVPAADVQAALVAGAGPLLESVRLFDEYVGAQVGQGKRSLAFALRLRAPDRTVRRRGGRRREAALAEARTGAVLRA
jgi:phenylalanyl-tRNA synthetase beta chain